jgi:hypothetical protein
LKRGKIEIGASIVTGISMLALALWVTIERMEFSGVVAIWVFFGLPGLALFLAGLHWINAELTKAFVGITLVVFNLILWLNGVSYVMIPIVLAVIGLLMGVQAVRRIWK